MSGTERVPQTVWSGTFRVMGVELQCHVLDNGKRVIEHDSMAALLDAMANGTAPAEPGPDADAFARWQRGG